MRKFIKVILPPFTGFAIYFVAVRYSSLYFTLRIDEMGSGNLVSFMAFYRYLMPLLFVVAVLTQLLIINPIARSVSNKSRSASVWAFILLILICAVFAAGISYAIWDRTSGVLHLFKTFVFLTMIQLVYWIIDLLILKLLGGKNPEKVSHQKGEEEQT